MSTTTKKLECIDGGERLDVFLAANLSGLTRSAAQRLIEAGCVTLGGSDKCGMLNGSHGVGASCEAGESQKLGNGGGGGVPAGGGGGVPAGGGGGGVPSGGGGGVPAGSAGGGVPSGKVLRKNHKTSPGETYFVTQDEPESPGATPQNIPLDIVYEDKDVIVVNKPRGMVVHPAPGHQVDTLVNALLHHCGSSLSGIGGVKRPGIVHRIDKDTSGLIIAAKNDHAHLALAAQLSSRTLTREYDSVVRGVIKNDSGTISAPIGRHPIDRKRQAVIDKNSRPAVTHYEVVSRFIGYTYVRCRLETGRTHQIRVHMAHIGHPILGDVIYGCKKPELGLSGQCLHARKLKFLHPSTGDQIELSTDLPEYFAEVLIKLERLK